MRPSIGLALAVTLAAPSTATALTLVDQGRRVSAVAGFFPSGFGDPTFDSDTEVAPDFGPFVATASAGANLASASASQSSTITLLGSAGLSVIATGVGEAGASNITLFPGFGSGTGTSDLSLTFALDEPMPFELSASISGSTVVFPPPDLGGMGGMSARIALLDGTGAVVAELARSSPHGSPPSQFDETELFSGILQPGTYTLRARAEGIAAADQYFPGPESGFASFGLELSIVPEPAPAGLVALGLALLAARRKAS
jgi:hypothetical protein